MLMPDDYQRIELITETARRRRWTTEQKLRIVEASYAPDESFSSVARQHGGGAPSVVAQGSSTAAGSGEEVVPASEYRSLQNQMRGLHRRLGKKTPEETLEHASAALFIFVPAEWTSEWTARTKRQRLPPQPPAHPRRPR
jgi:transposase